MKYDEYEKVESNDYPNENVLVELGKPKQKSAIRGKFRLNLPKNSLDIAIGGVFFAMSFALVLLFTSVITMAVSGSLQSTLMSIFG